MKVLLSTKRERALTLIELLVVMVVVGFLTLMILEASTPRRMSRAPRITCVNNLKQVGLAYRIWEGDHGNDYPMAVSETNGGTMEFITGMSEFRHFQVMSNELSTPRVLICPTESDRNRKVATNFTAFGNANLSYFVGIVPNETNATLILSGDRNITNGTPIRIGILELATNRLAGWTSEFHKRVGNILLADGSVQEDSISGLQNQIANTGVATNRVQMPVLSP